MKDKKELNLKEKERVIRNMIKSYKRAQRYLEIKNFEGVGEESSNYVSNQILSHLVESALKECSKDTQLIIENEYMKKSFRNWYFEYYSRSTYYRIKHKALDEFIDCLNL